MIHVPQPQHLFLVRELGKFCEKLNLSRWKLFEKSSTFAFAFAFAAALFRVYVYKNEKNLLSY